MNDCCDSSISSERFSAEGNASHDRTNAPKYSKAFSRTCESENSSQNGSHEAPISDDAEL